MERRCGSCSRRTSKRHSYPRLIEDRLHLLRDPAVCSALATELGRAIEYHDEIASTQDRARELGAPAIVVADHQTAGRGTRDRQWLAPPGTSLLVSFRYGEAPAGIASLIAGVAVARALDSLGTKGTLLKWPNDVLLDGRKVAGVLAHATTGIGASVVIGIGINVSQRPDDLPPELRATATSLAQSGGAVDRLALLVRLAAELDRALASPEQALAEWRARSAVLGREVTVTRPGAEVVRGVARDLGADGALVLETPYGPLRIITGEVTVRT